MKQWKKIIGAAILSAAILGSCGSQKQPDLTCKSLLENGFGMTEEQFLDGYQINQDALLIKEQASTADRAYYLAETAPLAGYETPVQLWFYETDDGNRLEGVRYRIYFTDAAHQDEVQKRLDGQMASDEIYYPDSSIYLVDDPAQAGYEAICKAYEEVVAMLGEMNGGYTDDIPLESIDGYEAFLAQYQDSSGYHGEWHWDITEAYGENICETGDSLIPTLTVLYYDQDDLYFTGLELSCMRTRYRSLIDG